MRRQDNLGIAFQTIIYGGQHGSDAGVVGNVAVLIKRDVEIHPDEKGLALDINLIKKFHRQLLLLTDYTTWRPTYDARSSIRLEKPISLSYQAITFTRVPPMTLVSSASTTAEKPEPLWSIDTRGSNDTDSIPARGPAAAATKAWFTSSLETARVTVATRSTMETLGVGTRMERPSR